MATATAIVRDTARIWFSGGYNRPLSKSSGDTSSDNVFAAVKNKESGIIGALEMITPNPTPGKIYTLLPWLGIND